MTDAECDEIILLANYHPHYSAKARALVRAGYLRGLIDAQKIVEKRAGRDAASLDAAWSAHQTADAISALIEEQKP